MQRSRILLDICRPNGVYWGLVRAHPTGTRKSFNLYTILSREGNLLTCPKKGTPG